MFVDQACFFRYSEDDFVLKHGQIPDTEVLEIDYYPSMRMPAWWREDPALSLLILERLTLEHCLKVKHLPPLRCLPCLKFLYDSGLPELEYMEEGESVSTTPFFRSLRELKLERVPNLRGWSKPVNAATATTSRISPDRPLFPLLEQLVIEATPHLVSMPPAPHLQLLRLESSHIDLVNQLLSTSSHFQEIQIDKCAMTSFAGEGLTFLRKLQIGSCPELRNVKVAPGAVKELIITGCPKMELWVVDREEEERSIRWSSFYNLCYLDHDQVPKTGRLPHCLHQLLKLGKIQLGYHYRWEMHAYYIAAGVRSHRFSSIPVHSLMLGSFVKRRILRLEERTAHLEGLVRLYSPLNSEEASSWDPTPTTTEETSASSTGALL